MVAIPKTDLIIYDQQKVEPAVEPVLLTFKGNSSLDENFYDRFNNYLHNVHPYITIFEKPDSLLKPSHLLINIYEGIIDMRRDLVRKTFDDLPRIRDIEIIGDHKNLVTDSIRYLETQLRKFPMSTRIENYEPNQYIFFPDATETDFYKVNTTRIFELRFYGGVNKNGI